MMVQGRIPYLVKVGGGKAGKFQALHCRDEPLDITPRRRRR